jgi:hypothetical protein
MPAPASTNAARKPQTAGAGKLPVAGAWALPFQPPPAFLATRLMGSASAATELFRRNQEQVTSPHPHLQPKKGHPMKHITIAAAMLLAGCQTSDYAAIKAAVTAKKAIACEKAQKAKAVAQTVIAAVEDACPVPAQ